MQSGFSPTCLALCGSQAAVHLGQQRVPERLAMLHVQVLQQVLQHGARDRESLPSQPFLRQVWLRHCFLQAWHTGSAHQRRQSGWRKRRTSFHCSFLKVLHLPCH